MGHTVSRCSAPEQRTCTKCKQQGHVSRDCTTKKKKLRLSLPDVVGDNFEHQDAEAEAPVPMPDLPTGWEELDMEEEARLDAHAILKALNRDLDIAVPEVDTTSSDQTGIDPADQTDSEPEDQTYSDPQEQTEPDPEDQTTINTYDQTEPELEEKEQMIRSYMQRSMSF